ncbi:lactoylglutathione lyase [Weissella uvarum]|uniref:VOC family protein n=1 Tax=Weissella uvarum TaxID=1479233 RepID=UPI0019608F0E|nr:VOC family protein [Weissella uvarum]MBM7617021.1 lactoylglutathione lyase [Weissella uvarum]MCM0595319.1 VOC family protein [Weissella uvarum]
MQNEVNEYTTGLQHIGIPTRDMEATKEFWTKLGFNIKGEFMNGDVQVKFFEYKGVVIEAWEGTDEEANETVGAINHISLDTTDADALFKEFQKSDFVLLNDEVQHLPFWDNGIKFFNIQGPDKQIVEFCEIVK